MRYLTAFSLLALLGSLAIAMEPDKEPPAAAPKNVGDNNGWLQFVAAREKTLVRITELPFTMDVQLALRCDLPRPNDRPENNPHRGHQAHIYVTPGGEETLRSGNGTYPVGTLIVKEKFPGPHAENRDPVKAKKTDRKPQPELFTVMLKREAGYHPECGDWEFMLVTGDLQNVAARGKIDSCVACHQEYKQTDYVSRAYMPKK
jgi:hypothetical protein